MEFDSFTVSLLVLREDAPVLDAAAAAALQDFAARSMRCVPSRRPTLPS